MSYSRHKIDSRRANYLSVVGSIESQLRDAYAYRYNLNQETQATLARKLGVDRSAINHRLHGKTNMTIKTLSDMAWALGHCIKVDIFPEEGATSKNHTMGLAPYKPSNVGYSESMKVETTAGKVNQARYLEEETSSTTTIYAR